MENSTAVYTYYQVSDTTDYEDYDTTPNISSGICSRTWLRQFRGRYEPPLFWLIFVLGAVGNLLVIWIYMTVRNRIKTMTDMYLLNLAVADLCFLCTLPLWATEATRSLDFSAGSCKLVSAIYKINFFSSMLLLACISVDRYIAIVQAAKAQNWKKRGLLYSSFACVGVWLLSILLALPEFIHAQLKTHASGETYCSLVYTVNTNNQVKITVLSVQICLGFMVPMLVLITCYSAIIRKLLQARNFQKHKALRVIFAVVLVFVVSQLPHNILLIMETAQAATGTMDCPTQQVFDVAVQISKSLAYTHACLNPFLYVFIGVRFRQDLLQIAKRCAGRLSHQRYEQAHAVPKRPSLMSDTDTTPALSL
ncbi:C-C chemokine receptor type 9 [Synchiropus splendidus]|uniref:C-C chemokine receptor type 9 n=1 Tax=Synchiropus splendidus TaxID=270530 RepID=UPI00237D8580|nr:C-C chemokine receptor type 9 [Synchiropus splendidus]